MSMLRPRVRRGQETAAAWRAEGEGGDCLTFRFWDVGFTNTVTLSVYSAVPDLVAARGHGRQGLVLSAHLERHVGGLCVLLLLKLSLGGGWSSETPALCLALSLLSNHPVLAVSRVPQEEPVESHKVVRVRASTDF